MTNSVSTSLKLSGGPVSSKSLLAHLLGRAIRTYQRFTAGRVSPCRFYPSCSQYAAEAIDVHGALRGSALALRRLSRCRPLGPHGIDLVPEPKQTRSAE
jgi:uncharacterized protein